MSRRNSGSGLDSLKLSVAREMGLPGTSTEQQFQQTLESWKYEVANELGLNDRIATVGWSNMTSKECGKVGGKMGGNIGGKMVRRMIEFAESNLR